MIFYDKVYAVTAKIPLGTVASYGMIAAAAGNPRASRVVGTALHNNPKPGIIPCHRVVNREGYLAGGFAFGGIDIQRQLLEKEGVAVDSEYKVDMAKYCVLFKTLALDTEMNTTSKE